MRSKVADLFSIIDERIKSHMDKRPAGVDAIICPSSYNATNGTVDVVLTKTISNVPLYIYNVSLQAPIYGDQGGPVGGEPVVLSSNEGGWIAQPVHIASNSPGAPSGERWILPPSRNGSSIKLTGANGGSVEVVAPGQADVTAPKITRTATTNIVDMAPIVQINASNVVEINASNAVEISASGSASMIAPSTEIGPMGGPYLNIGSGGGGSQYALIRLFELQELITIFNAHIHTNGNDGNDTGPPTTSGPVVTGATNVSAE